MSLRPHLVHARSKAGLAEAAVKNVRLTPGGKLDRSKERMIGANGEINANNKQELVERLAGLFELFQQGEVQASNQMVDAEYGNECEKIVSAAMEDREHGAGGGFWVMGETLGDAVWETTGRLGFTSKFLLRHDVPRGQEGRIRVRQKNVVSWIITRESYIPRSIIRQNWVYPEVVTISTYVTIDDTERAMAPVERRCWRPRWCARTTSCAGS